MSLLNSATPWTNDDVQPKKRISSMRKTVKSTPYTDVKNDNNYIAMSDISDTNRYNSSTETSVSIQNLHSENDNKVSRVNELIQKITHENDGNKLANFQPLDKPFLNSRKEPTENTQKMDYNSDDLLPVNPMLQSMNIPSNKNVAFNFGSNDGDLANYSNYRSVYEAKDQPYYSKMAPATSNNLNDNRLLEKINYMIHLLEEQKNERTNNITEEFILYIFLGVFMIFTVDSFTRAGKYVR